MTMLEASLRKLVREEAANAAVETVETIRQGVDDRLGEIRKDLSVIAAQEFSVAQRRLTTWSRLNVPRPEAGAEWPLSDNARRDNFVAELRRSALELAAKLHGSDIPLTMDTAAQFARFLIDGCLDGKPRPVGDLPDYDTAKGELEA